LLQKTWIKIQLAIFYFLCTATTLLHRRGAPKFDTLIIAVLDRTFFQSNLKNAI